MPDTTQPTPAEPESGDLSPEQLEGTQPITDILMNMFIRQLGHKAEYDKIYRAKGLNPVPPGEWGNLNSPQLQAELRSTAGYMVEELYEAIGLLKNKPWAKTARPTDPDIFYEELADFWHFMLEFMILAGMMPDKVARYYFGKAEVNDQRRANDY